MEYTIEVKKSYIYIKTNGQIPSKGEAGWEYIKPCAVDALNTAKANNIFKLFFDAYTVSGKLETMDRYLMAEFLTKENHQNITAGFPPLKIVCVLSESMIDPRRFGQVVGRNRGLNIFVTTDMQEAINWLHKEEP